ncbi:hypothetical protein WQ57_09870 [Mesobacillus campisalis]|uniref:Uncharacterized protein n=1 Tax=Mesobacillus campisalis TaxID=1408103 RepID=A0A0M2SYR4_9BACI|nr:hypothetical protein [Mesobacillus campisalis]KKK38117.1 hypothetical protein WQ57_09870 [Mesobacillus campisalis]
MGLALTLVAIILIFSIISTLLVAGKGDEGYGNAAKRNTTNLTFIYVIVILLSLITLGAYIQWFS